MPVLDVRSEGRITLIDIIMVVATMRFPQAKDAEKRMELQVAFEADFLSSLQSSAARGGGDFYIAMAARALDIFPEVVDKPRLRDILEESNRAIENVWVTNFIVLNFLSAAVHHRKTKPNVSRMIYALGQFLENNNPPGRRPVTGEDAIKFWWKRFRSVAHLFLAGFILESWGLNDSRLNGKDVPRYFLSISENIRKAVVEEGLVKGEVTWRVPGDFKGNADGFDIRKLVSPLRDDLLEHIKNYTR